MPTATATQGQHAGHAKEQGSLSQASQLRFDTEGELYNYWIRIGGTAGWQQHISGEDLSAVLDANAHKIKKANVALHQGQWVHKVVVVDEAEITGYISVILSRLPKLHKLRIYAAKKVWPFDWNLIRAVPTPFPTLVHVGLVRTTWDEEKVRELTEGIPSLVKASLLLSRGCGVGVYKANGPAKKEEQQIELKKNNPKLDFLD